jgi:hypothetical protein
VVVRGIPTFRFAPREAEAKGRNGYFPVAQVSVLALPHCGRLGPQVRVEAYGPHAGGTAHCALFLSPEDAKTLAGALTAAVAPLAPGNEDGISYRCAAAVDGQAAPPGREP